MSWKPQIWEMLPTQKLVMLASYLACYWSISIFFLYERYGKWGISQDNGGASQRRGYEEHEKLFGTQRVDNELLLHYGI